jgi:hypothetical protein
VQNVSPLWSGSPSLHPLTNIYDLHIAQQYVLRRSQQEKCYDGQQILIGIIGQPAVFVERIMLLGSDWILISMLHLPYRIG